MRSCSWTTTGLKLIDVDEPLVHRAGALADLHSLRDYDGTPSKSINDVGVVAARGNQPVIVAWRALGVNTLDVNDR